ncbi:MAG: DMP19 family protein, partial [Clostridiales bacterium]|nr:DMP19 family protein [Clostridiales bacterium]
MFILDANGLVKNIKEISDKRERVLYYSYHYNAEIENGGHIQLFVNKDDWNFEEMQELFAPIYSADLCENLRKAVV